MKALSKTVARTAIAAAIIALSAPVYAQQGPVTGAVFTTGIGCVAVNGNIYQAKSDVYLDGGPARVGSAGLLSLTSYYVQVTDPNGLTVLGSSLNNIGVSDKPLTTNSVGDVVGCLELDKIVSQSPGVFGYADTPNMGGEYKVWISTDPKFQNQYTKTDNFKLQGPNRPTGPGTITVIKFYDANTNGIQDNGEPELTGSTAGWLVDYLGSPTIDRTRVVYSGLGVADPLLGSQTYTVREYQPIESNWYSTYPTPISFTPTYLNQTAVTLSSDSPSYIVKFGNVCTGPGNGYTLGFWSSKNGQAAISAAEKKGRYMLTELSNLTLVNDQGQTVPWKLVNGSGAGVTFATYDQLRTWLLNGTATNMAYMLSVQYATMYLNMNANPVKNVDPDALVNADGVPGANDAGFAKMSVVMNAAAMALYKSPLTLAGSPYRPVEESIKNALDQANNNRTFVQPTACPYSFSQTATPTQ